MGAEQGQGWLLGGAGFRAGGTGGSCVEQRDRNVAMRGTARDVGRKKVGVKTDVTSCTASLLRRLRYRRRSLILDAAAAQSLTYLGHVRRRPKLFWPHGFFNAGAPATRGSTMLYSGTA